MKKPTARPVTVMPSREKIKNKNSSSSACSPNLSVLLYIHTHAMICKDWKCTRMPTCLCGGNDAGVLQKVNLVTANDGIKDLNPLRSKRGWKLTQVLYLVSIGLSGNVSWLLRWWEANHAWNACTSFHPLYLHYPHSLNVNKAVEMFENIDAEL